MIKPTFRLETNGKLWLVTGVAGFIGSNLLEALLNSDQRVVGLDNFATGHRKNLDQVRAAVSPEQWRRFKFLRGDIRRLEDCRRALQGVHLVLHQAALGSVPRSVNDPLASHASNVTGFANLLLAARDAKVARFVYASSSSVYGDDKHLPKLEQRVGLPVSPYAATKAMNEIYAAVFARCYGIQSIGLRYFNVFGPRQDPDNGHSTAHLQPSTFPTAGYQRDNQTDDLHEQKVRQAQFAVMTAGAPHYTIHLWCQVLRIEKMVGGLGLEPKSKASKAPILAARRTPYGAGSVGFLALEVPMTGRNFGLLPWFWWYSSPVCRRCRSIQGLRRPLSAAHCHLSMTQ